MKWKKEENADTQVQEVFRENVEPIMPRKSARNFLKNPTVEAPVFAPSKVIKREILTTQNMVDTLGNRLADLLDRLSKNAVSEEFRKLDEKNWKKSLKSATKLSELVEAFAQLEQSFDYPSLNLNLKPKKN